MTVYEWLTVVLAAALILVSFVAFFLGVLAWFGGAYIVRCQTCRHLTVSTGRDPQPSCVQCRHPVLTHPVYSARHPHQMRVVDDPLRY